MIGRTPKAYETVYGVWEVTTEGDVEGRTTKHLGTFEGYVDEIALYLADSANYGLTFSLTEPVKRNFEPTRRKVHVKFDIDSGTWNMDSITRMQKMEKLFADRPVHIEESNYHASFVITTEKDIRAEDRKRALDKLTDYEKELLGVK